MQQLLLRVLSLPEIVHDLVQADDGALHRHKSPSARGCRRPATKSFAAHFRRDAFERPLWYYRVGQQHVRDSHAHSTVLYQRRFVGHKACGMVAQSFDWSVRQSQQSLLCVWCACFAGLKSPIAIISTRRDEYERLQKLSPTLEKKVDAYRSKILALFPRLMHRWFMRSTANPTEWFNKRRTFARSCGAWSIVGYIFCFVLFCFFRFVLVCAFQAYATECTIVVVYLPSCALLLFRGAVISWGSATATGRTLCATRQRANVSTWILTVCLTKARQTSLLGVVSHPQNVAIFHRVPFCA